MNTTTITDAVLTQRVGTGDPAALSMVFDRHAATITRYAWAIVENRMDVDEVLQDTFVTMWVKAPGLHLPDDSLLPWLLVVARNHARNLRRKRQRAASDELPFDLPAPADDERRDAAETLRFVRGEIAALGDVDRRICELCLLEGRSYTEAAAELGLTVGAVTKRVSRNRARLRKAVTTDEH